MGDWKNPNQRDPMIVAARRANLGTRLELDRHGAKRLRRDRYSDLERELEQVKSILYLHIASLADDGLVR